MKKLPLLLSLFIFLSVACFPQNSRIIDSLQNELRKLEAGKMGNGSRKPDLADSLKANLLFGIYNEFKVVDYDSAVNYAKECLKLSESIGYKKGMGNGYIGIAEINCIRGDYQTALESLQKALSLYGEIGYKLGLANTYLAMGNNYISEGNHSEALNNYLKGLKLFDEIGTKKILHVPIVI